MTARWLLYPVCFFGGCTALLHALARDAPYWLVGPGVATAMAVVVIGLERLRPYNRTWLSSQGDTWTDLTYLLLNLGVSHASVALFASLDAVSKPLLDLWPHSSSLTAQVLLSSLLVDLGLYAVHRTSHHHELLWRMHAIHHSPLRLYWMNGQRRHVLHELIEGLPGMSLLLVMGAPWRVYAASVTVITLHLMWQHANIDYRVGRLKYVFAVAELHRWHHQRSWREAQGNYGALLSVWDWVLGTALSRSGPGPESVGTDDASELPRGFMGQATWPFRRPRTSTTPAPTARAAPRWFGRGRHQGTERHAVAGGTRTVSPGSATAWPASGPPARDGGAASGDSGQERGS